MKEQSFFSEEFLKDVGYVIVKWLFAVVVAAIPVVLVILHGDLKTGDLSMPEVIAHGELFIVSIVMVAEPLASIIMSGVRNTLSLVWGTCIIGVLVVSGFYYSQVKNNKQHLETVIILTEDETKEIRICRECNLSSHSEVHSLTSFPIQTSIDTSKHSKEILHDRLSGKCILYRELAWATYRVMGFSFLLGIVSLIHLKMLKHRVRNIKNISQ